METEKPQRPGRTAEVIDEIDAYVGGRIRRRRTLIGVSQEKLAEALGVSFQQVQKYERGVNRIGAGRLWRIGRLLGVDIGFFFEEAARYESVPRGAPSLSLKESGGTGADPFAGKDAIRLLQAFSRIKDARVAKKIVELVRSMAEEPAADADEE